MIEVGNLTYNGNAVNAVTYNGNAVSTFIKDDYQWSQESGNAYLVTYNTGDYIVVPALMDATQDFILSQNSVFCGKITNMNNNWQIVSMKNTYCFVAPLDNWGVIVRRDFYGTYTGGTHYTLSWDTKFSVGGTEYSIKGNATVDENEYNLFEGNYIGKLLKVPYNGGTISQNIISYISTFNGYAEYNPELFTITAEEFISGENSNPYIYRNGAFYECTDGVGPGGYSYYIVGDKVMDLEDTMLSNISYTPNEHDSVNGVLSATVSENTTDDFRTFMLIVEKSMVLHILQENYSDHRVYFGVPSVERYLDRLKSEKYGITSGQDYEYLIHTLGSKIISSTTSDTVSYECPRSTVRWYLLYPVAFEQEYTISCNTTYSTIGYTLMWGGIEYKIMNLLKANSIVTFSK